MSIQVLADVILERQRQDLKWGGAEHDDQHTIAEFVRFIKLRGDLASEMERHRRYGDARHKLIQVAALAVAAVESIDRHQQEFVQGPDNRDPCCEYCRGIHGAPPCTCNQVKTT